MNRYTTPLKNASVAFNAMGVWNAVVTGVPDHRLMVRVPRLSGDMEYGPLYVVGESTDTYSIGDPVIVSFLEGKQDELIVIGRAKQTNELPAVIEGPQGATGPQGPQGATGPVAGSANQVVYKDGSNVASGSANLTFNGTDLSLGGRLNVNGSSGDEGGEIILSKAQTNTTLVGAVAVDVFRDKLRFYETGGTNRGFYLDVSSAGATASTQLGTTFTYKVGDTGPGGGIIFFVDRYDEHTGFTYLEVAPVTTEVLRTWAPSSPVNYQSTLVTGADSMALGAGYQNTIDIVAQGHTNTATSAAYYCDQLTFGGQSDWYLGSVAEMKMVYDVVHLRLGVGGFSAVSYWSSSESVATSAWTQTFFSGSQSAAAKTNSYSVRPVRRFS